MGGKALGSIGFAVSAAGAALILSVAALAQDPSSGEPAAELADPAAAVTAERLAQEDRRKASITSHCGGKLAQFLKELTSPPNRFGSDCSMREEW